MSEFDIRNQMTEKEQDNALRPLSFSDFAGQTKIVNNLRIFVEAAKLRGESLDHTLLFGPPGLGKTTLSNIIANELGVGFKVTSGPVLDKPGDLAGLLTSLEPNDVLFIDEIHRLSPIVEEYLYSAMEDYRIDIMIDKGPSARTIQIDLNHFTLIGATTRSGLLTSPLRARFGINCHLEYYDADVLSQRADNVLGLLAEPFEGDELSGFQWYSIDAAGDTTAIDGQVSATLNWYDLPADQYNGNTYFLCFYKNRGTEKEVRTCTCDKGFTGDDGDLVFEIPDSITIVQQNMAHIGERIFVNAKLPSTLTWLTVDGTAYATEDIPAGGRTVEVPDREGFYILRVATLAEKKKDVQTRNFKFLVTK